MALAKPPAVGRTLAIRSQGWRAAGASLHCWLKLVGGCGAGAGSLIFFCAPSEGIYRQNPAVGQSLRVKKAVLYFERRPVRLRSMATSLSAFQIKKLGFFSPHWTYGTTK